MQDESYEHWIVAEERDDGTQWPLFLVTTEPEAVDLVRPLRGDGGDLFAVPSRDSDGAR